MRLPLSTQLGQPLRVAVVHEWLITPGGSELVTAEILKMFPDADLFTMVHDPVGMKGTIFEGRDVTTSFIQRLPFSKRLYKQYLPLLGPLAIEQYDLRKYDLVLSSSHAVAKGVLTRADQLHICYMHTPIRYVWDLYLDYLRDSGMQRGIKTLIARPILHYLRLWDSVTPNRVDYFLANSRYIADRIQRVYRRSAQVVYPPVAVQRFLPTVDERGDYYIVVSRFVPYKRVDLIVEAFNRIDRKLIVIGSGPDFERVRRIAGANIELMGYQSAETVAEFLGRARAFIFAADEDFGIAPVEAQAAGCPVIAFGKGGVRETVIPLGAAKPTGVFFNEQSAEAIVEAVEKFEANESHFSPDVCRANAMNFSEEAFREKLEATVAAAWDEFGQRADLRACQ